MPNASSQLAKPHLLAKLGLSSPTLMAPMQGVGAPGVRDSIAWLGRPGMICAPFIRITAQRPSLDWVRSQLHRTGALPFSAQVLGSHPEHLALAARTLADAGVDVVDLNLGCPTRQAHKKGVGAALLSRIDSISRIVERMRAACGCKLSVKVRTSEGAPETMLDLARAIEAAGADFLIVHARTRAQGYDELADWGVVQRLKSTLTIPVVGNGDLWYAADALRLLRTSGADAIMLGRPALRNPFIFRQIDELNNGVSPFVPTGRDIVAHIERIAERMQIDLAHRYHGAEGAIKEQIQFVLRAVPEPMRANLWQRAMQAAGIPAIVRALEPLHDTCQLDLAANGPLRLESTPLDPSATREASPPGTRHIEQTNQAFAIEHAAK